MTRALSTCPARVCAPSAPDNLISCPLSPSWSAACCVLQCERSVLQQRRQSRVEPIMSQASSLSVAFWFCFCGSTPCHVAQAASETSLCLRPAEIWGNDDVSLKRRSITGSHVAHVTGSVWQRLLGARAHDMTRCQLDAERLVLAAGCSSCHATSVLCAVRALFYTCRLFQQCKQKRAPTPCSPISLSLAARVPLLLVATTRHARYVCSCVMKCSS